MTGIARPVVLLPSVARPVLENSFPILFLEEGSSTRFPGTDPTWEDSKWGTPPNCRPGSESEEGSCKPTFFCPSGFSRNSRTGWCDPDFAEEHKCNEDVKKPFCGSDHYYKKSLGRCVPCPCELSKGFVVGPSGGCVFRDVGKPCCPNKPWGDPCYSVDHVWDKQGGCTPREMPHCKLYGPLAKYDTVSGKCVCPEGYVRDEVKRACVPVDGGGGDKEQPLPPDVQGPRIAPPRGPGEPSLEG
jgi:hypothetical protein